MWHTCNLSLQFLIKIEWSLVIWWKYLSYIISYSWSNILSTTWLLFNPVLDQLLVVISSLDLFWFLLRFDYELQFRKWVNKCFFNVIYQALSNCIVSFFLRFNKWRPCIWIWWQYNFLWLEGMQRCIWPIHFKWICNCFRESSKTLW